MIQREQRLTRMRHYARSRWEAEDGADIVHGPTDGGPWLSGRKQSFTDHVVFCSATMATEASDLDFISKRGGGWLATPSTPAPPDQPLICCGGGGEQRLTRMRDGYSIIKVFIHCSTS